MSTWNHRVIAHTDPDGSTYYAIHEVHYDPKAVPAAYTEDPVPVLAEDLDGLRWVLDHMLKACEAPILLESDFVGDKDRV